MQGESTRHRSDRGGEDGTSVGPVPSREDVLAVTLALLMVLSMIAFASVPTGASTVDDDRGDVRAIDMMTVNDGQSMSAGSDRAGSASPDRSDSVSSSQSESASSQTESASGECKELSTPEVEAGGSVFEGELEERNTCAAGIFSLSELTDVPVQIIPHIQRMTIVLDGPEDKAADFDLFVTLDGREANRDDHDLVNSTPGADSRITLSKTEIPDSGAVGVGVHAYDVGGEYSIEYEYELGPPVAFLDGPDSGLTGEVLVYNASESVIPNGTPSADSIATYEWTFGDETLESDSPVMPYRFDEAGDHEVSVTVRGDEGYEDTTSMKVSVRDPSSSDRRRSDDDGGYVLRNVEAVADAWPDPARIEENVSFYGGRSTSRVLNVERNEYGHVVVDREQLTNELEYEWEIDGETYTGESAEAIFEEEGKVTASLTVTDSETGDTASDTITVEVFTPLVWIKDVHGTGAAFVPHWLFPNCGDPMWSEVIASEELDRVEYTVGDVTLTAEEEGGEMTWRANKNHLDLSGGEDLMTVTAYTVNGNYDQKQVAVETMNPPEGMQTLFTFMEENIEFINDYLHREEGEDPGLPALPLSLSKCQLRVEFPDIIRFHEDLLQELGDKLPGTSPEQPEEGDLPEAGDTTDDGFDAEDDRDTSQDGEDEKTGKGNAWDDPESDSDMEEPDQGIAATIAEYFPVPDDFNLGAHFELEYRPGSNEMRIGGGGDVSVPVPAYSAAIYGGLTISGLYALPEWVRSGFEFKANLGFGMDLLDLINPLPAELKEIGIPGTDFKVTIIPISIAFHITGFHTGTMNEDFEFSSFEGDAWAEFELEGMLGDPCYIHIWIGCVGAAIWANATANTDPWGVVPFAPQLSGSAGPGAGAVLRTPDIEIGVSWLSADVCCGDVEMFWDPEWDVPDDLPLGLRGLGAVPAGGGAAQANSVVTPGATGVTSETGDLTGFRTDSPGQAYLEEHSTKKK